MDIIFAIFVGVISGIVASILLSAAIKIFNNNVLPWYQSLVYKGINIDGEWNGFYKSEKQKKTRIPQLVVFIRQHGNQITGEWVLKSQPSGKKEIKTYSMRGVFRDNYLLLTFEPKDKTRFSAGTFLMELLEDGQKLEGKTTYIAATNSELSSIGMVWLRK